MRSPLIDKSEIANEKSEANVDTRIQRTYTHAHIHTRAQKGTEQKRK